MTDPIKNLILAKKFGDVTQWFGEHPGLYESLGLKAHNGIDIVRPYGEPIYAVEDGVIGFADTEGGYGKQIRLFSRDLKREWTYGHCSKLLVETGELVKEGQLIAFMGNTGFVVSGNTQYWDTPTKDGTHGHITLRLIEQSKAGWAYPGSDIKIDVLNYGNGYKGAVNPLPYLRDPKLLSSRVEDTGRRLSSKVWLDFGVLLRKIEL